MRPPWCIISAMSSAPLPPPSIPADGKKNGPISEPSHDAEGRSPTFLMPHPIQGVLMDLDGTLADTARDLVPILNALCLEENHPPVDYDTARGHVSQGARALVRLAFGGELGDDREERLVARLLELYAKAPCRETVLFDGMTDLLEFLARNETPWGVVTNKAGNLAEAIMEIMDFPIPPACLISGDTLARRKPHPEPLWEAARRMNVDAKRCLYLGDDPRDMQAARAAGMTGVIAAFGYIRPKTDLASWEGDATIRHPTELKAFLNHSA